MRMYEVIFIVKPMEEEATNAVIEKRLAYEINDHSEGYYVLLYVNAEPACVAECDRVMKITDDLLKHMIVRAENGVPETDKE